MRKLKEPTYMRFITGPLSRFDDRNGGFSRRRRREIAQGDHPNVPQVGRRGYEQKDYALFSAGLTIDNLVRHNLYSIDSQNLPIEALEAAKSAVDVSDKAANTRQVKSAARWFGADLVGICEVNPTWVYTHWGDNNTARSGGRFSPGDAIEIPSWFKYAIVMAVEMDYEVINRTPAFDAATPFGYARMAFVAPTLAAYIHQLGYHAMPCGNDIALSIPLAIDAGLGELARNALLITEPFGPRVRICKVFTDLPLEVDSPIDIGVQAFCERCERCAEACPSRAIPFGERTDEAWDESNSINVLKWPGKAENCLDWWRKNGTGTCAVCIRVCPYNKPKGWLHSSARKIVEFAPLFDRLLVKMDKALGYGKQVVR